MQARALKGQWRLRIDDLDRARCAPAAESEILRQLEAHGLHWDGAADRQSEHRDAYREALESLRRAGLVYRCTCTRALLAGNARPGPDGPVYPGTCRARPAVSGRAALRLRMDGGRIEFGDAGQGRQSRDAAAEIGDFVVRRSDGVIAYQLACAVDELRMGITEVVRGADLLASTFRQIAVQRALDCPNPAYRHVPVLVGANRRKLSKQNRAAPVLALRASENLLRCLRLLGQQPPPELDACTPQQILDWATIHWQPQRIPATPIVVVE